MTAEIEKLRAKEASIKRRIREIQSRSKSSERKERTARLIRWGIVVEAMLKAGKIEAADWIDACQSTLKGRDFEIATAKILPSSTDEAHLKVSQPTAEKPCAPAAGESA